MKQRFKITKMWDFTSNSRLEGYSIPTQEPSEKDNIPTIFGDFQTQSGLPSQIFITYYPESPLDLANLKEGDIIEVEVNKL